MNVRVKEERHQLKREIIEYMNKNKDSLQAVTPRCCTNKRENALRSTKNDYMNQSVIDG
jgi:hypothetical protein